MNPNLQSETARLYATVQAIRAAAKCAAVLTSADVERIVTETMGSES